MPEELRPATFLLEMDGDGVSAIHRIGGSGQTSSGETVLSDDVLRILRGHLFDIESVFPIDVDPPDGRRIFLGTEWKMTEAGALIIKQIRPFLY